MKCAVSGCPHPVRFSEKIPAPRGGPQVEVIRLSARHCVKHDKERFGTDPPPPRRLLTQQALAALHER